MKRFLPLLLLLFVLGCGSRDAQLVGTWKVEQIRDGQAKDKGILGTFADKVVGGLTQSMTLEFNKEGSVKVSVLMGSSSAKYHWDGDTLVVPADNKDGKPLKLKVSSDGKRLYSVREFSSDPQIVFEKVSGSQP